MQMHCIILICIFVLQIITGRRNTPSPPRSKLPLKTINRQMLCRDLDVPSALGSDWRELAGRIGLDMREIRLIEHGKHDSCTEEVELFY